DSNESIPPHMESTLQVVLEKVLATEEGVQDLRSKLLDLTTTVKSHDVIIQQLEERMNELASQVVAQTTEKTRLQCRTLWIMIYSSGKLRKRLLVNLLPMFFLKGEELKE
ncbi:hypothetical protein HAX54_024260, partial [Datura stramonium]|nr:hypothetical protein [Datura stramonium]